MTAARADLQLVVELDDLDVPEDTPEVDRWEPDEHLIASVLASPKAWRGMLKQPEPDRSLLVAGLTVAGLTAKQIADRTSCSLRLIRFIRAKDMTQVCVYALEQTAVLEGQLYAERSQNVLLRQQLAEAQRCEQRLQAQLDQVIDAHIAGTLTTFPTCGHPFLKYNKYEHRGRVYCRECNRDRATKYRARRKSRGRSGNHTECVTILTAPQISTVAP